MRASRGDKVVAQVQQDMTAVQLPGDALGVAFVQDSRAVSLELTKDVEALAAVYAGICGRAKILHPGLIVSAVYP
jgi:hypothetical protein